MMNKVRFIVGEIAYVLDHHIFKCRWDWLCNLVEWEFLNSLKD